jgi:hypothetical protein
MDMFTPRPSPKRQRPARPAWQRKAVTRTARLRKLLADGQWHNALAMMEAGGMRYGARVHEIRRGEDGRPAWRVDMEYDKDTGAVRYRAMGEGVASCPG